MSKKSKSESAKVKAGQDLASLTADLQRVQADFVNYRRRQDDERAQLVDFAKQEVVKKLLPIFDNIERALAHVPKELKDSAWAQGVAQVAKQAELVLADLGVEKIKTTGEAFNPHLHEAISAEGEGEDEVVTEEMQAGYKIGNEVIRPSMVKVRKE